MFSLLFLLIIASPFILFLIAFTFSKSILFLVTKDTVHLRNIMYLYLILAALLFVLMAYVYFYQSNYGRVTFSKEHIIGSYEIDNSFYPGVNADWQKSIYRFDITTDDKLVFYEKLKDNSEKVYINDIRWNFGPPYHWSLNVVNEHHVIDPRPTLFRSSNNRKFYYVFKSKKFGNMFFRKVKGS